MNVKNTTDSGIVFQWIDGYAPGRGVSEFVDGGTESARSWGRGRDGDDLVGWGM